MGSRGAWGHPSMPWCRMPWVTQAGGLGGRLYRGKAVGHGPPQGPVSLPPPETRSSPETRDHHPSLFHQPLGLGDMVLSRRAGGPLHPWCGRGHRGREKQLPWPPGPLGPGQGQTGSPAQRPLTAEPHMPLLPGARTPPTAARPTDLGSATHPGPGSAPSGNWRPVLGCPWDLGFTGPRG